MKRMSFATGRSLLMRCTILPEIRASGEALGVDTAFSIRPCIFCFCSSLNTLPNFHSPMFPAQADLKWPGRDRERERQQNERNKERTGEGGRERERKERREKERKREREKERKREKREREKERKREREKERERERNRERGEKARDRRADQFDLSLRCPIGGEVYTSLYSSSHSLRL